MSVRLEARRPRKIRAITHWSRVSTPKQVKDYRLNVSIRWIKAINPHKCMAGKQCRQGELIQPNQTYAQVIWQDQRIRLGARGSMPMAEKRHLGCVPREMYPLMRLLFPARTRPYPQKRHRLTWY